MADDVHLAFEHPEERSKATATFPLDRISLRDHIVEAEIGAFQVERGLTQRMSFNVVVEVSPSTGADTDDVDDILSYDKVTEAIATEMAVERLNLLETLAERVAERILIEPQAMRVFVRIEKLDRGAGKLGVEIVRGKGKSTQNHQHIKIAPIVVHLSNSALSSSNLSGWIDQCSASQIPVILSLEPLAQQATAKSEDMRRRIALLSVEQNALLLADKDPRCFVVGSRTELDWGIKNGQLSVWAPSKLVNDSVDSRMIDMTRPETLGVWFAGEIGASKLMIVGGSPIENHIETTVCDVNETLLPL